MTPKMEVVASPFDAHLEIDGNEFPLTSFQVDYIAHQVSQAFCNLAVGFAGDSSGGRGASALQIPHGTPAKLVMNVYGDVEDPVSGTLLLQEGEQTVFNGFLDDIGPGNLAMGQFNVRAKLVSRLQVLNGGSLQMSKLTPRSWLDTTVGLPRFKRTDVRDAKTGQGFTLPDVDQDFWGALKKVLLAIANTGELGGNAPQANALKEFIDFFNDGGNNPNVEAAAVLNDIVGSLIPGPMKTAGLTRGLPTHLNTLFSGDWRMDSFLTRILNMGQEYKFRLIESFSTIQVVPYSPFFSEDKAVEIHPSTIYDINWHNRQPNNILGCGILMNGPVVVGSQGSRTDPVFLIGKYKRPVTSTSLGSIVSLPGPCWMTRRGTFDNLTAVHMADLGVQEAVGNPYAKECALEMAYVGSQVQVSTPMRTDIGLLTPVKLIYPEISGTELGPAVYGSVQAVSIQADALQKRAGTVMEIGYVRSQTLQSAELSSHNHPLWTELYGGGRLDD